MTRTFHPAVSVDVARFSDRELTRKWLPFFRQLGAKNAGDIRMLCGAEAAKGHEVFPPCDNVDARGLCAGHEVVAGVSGREG